MFSKFFTTTTLVLAIGLQVNAHAGVTPALGVSGNLTRNQVKRPSASSPCGAGVNIATDINSATPVAADATGSFNAEAVSFDKGLDGSRQVTAAVDPTGTGNSFTALTVSTNGDLKPTSVGSQPIVAALPAGTTCTGGSSGNLCLVQFKTAGGFGNCVAVSQSGANATGADAGSASANATSVDASSADNSTTIDAGAAASNVTDVSSVSNSTDLSGASNSTDLSSGSNSTDLSSGSNSTDVSSGSNSTDLSSGSNSTDLSSGSNSTDVSSASNTTDLGASNATDVTSDAAGAAGAASAKAKKAKKDKKAKKAKKASKKKGDKKAKAAAGAGADSTADDNAGAAASASDDAAADGEVATGAQATGRRSLIAGLRRMIEARATVPGTRAARSLLAERGPYRESE